MRSSAIGLAALLLCPVFVGCGDGDSGSSRSDSPVALPTAPQIEDPAATRWEKLEGQLRALNPQYNHEQASYQGDSKEIAEARFDDTGLRDIAPLAELPLKFLSLKGCPVTDLSPIGELPLAELALEETPLTDLAPLSGMPLQVLWLNNTPVADLEPLAGLPLTSLNLLGTKVSDLSPLRGMPLETLWLNETQVIDLSPLADCPLVSLTLHKTPVRDISVVRRLPALQRLHLGETEVADLRPLAGLRLTRLILTPGRITEGLDVVRQMDTLQELDIELREDRRWSPDEFWRLYDAGGLR